MRVQTLDELRIGKEAAEWLDRLQEGGSRANAAFTKWLVTSPLHVKAFLDVTAIERLLNGVDAKRSIDVERLLADCSNVQPLPSRIDISEEAHALLSVSHRRRRWVAAAAASIAVVVMAGWLLSFNGKTIATVRGEQRTVELADGSILNLNTSSSVKVLFSGSEREVHLEGEAMFKVAPDLKRPFRVYSGNTVIEAIGTQFNVHRRPSGTVVSVIEGAVQVSDEVAATELQTNNVLKAGDELRVGRDGTIERRSHQQIAGIPVWLQQRLVFSDERLDDIVAEFNRWNRRQIHIEDAAVAARLYSGAFDADDPESLLAFLARDPALLIGNQGENRVIRSKKPI